MSRTIEVTIFSGENIQANKKPIKGNTFVTVQSDGSSEIGTTKMNSEGGSYPSWNEKLVIDVPLHARFITIDVKCRTSSRGSSNSVGMTRIPISDFIGGYVVDNQLQFLSYRLWDNKVRRNGVVNISVKVKPLRNSCSNSVPSSVNGVPVTGVPVGGNGSTGVVTGIPAVWLNYQRNI